MQNPDKSHPQPRPLTESGQVEIVSRKALTIGMAVSIALLAGMVLWRFAARVDPGKKLAEFQFSVQEPEKEEFDLEEPMRDLVAEQGEHLDMVVEVSEQPGMVLAVVPAEVSVVEEVVAVRSIEVKPPEVEVVEFREVEVDEPEQISEAPDAVDPVAEDLMVAASVGPTNLFKFDLPTAHEGPGLFVWSRAAKPVRALKTLTRTFDTPENLSLPELAAISVTVAVPGEESGAAPKTTGGNARSAVDAALRWLALHQEADGRWSPEKYEGKNSDAGNTALALLALMGGGNTPRRGEYRRQVTKGLEWLLRQQQADGRLGGTMYEHALATLAFSEACGRAQDERMGEAARRCMSWIERTRLADGAWRYHPNSQFSDVSVTGWVIQALKAAKLAQVKFDTRMYAQALLFLGTVTDRGGGPNTSGAVGYIYESSQNYPHSAYPAMTCAGMLIRQLSGINPKSEVLVKGAALTRAEPPEWNRKNFYYWYYATCAMHNMGDENRIWWNRRIRDVLVENQSQAGDHAGSWDPRNDAWAEQGGRIYTTALGALCLEVSYRYADTLNGFGVAPGVDELLAQ